MFHGSAELEVDATGSALLQVTWPTASNGKPAAPDELTMMKTLLRNTFSIRAI